MNVIFDLFISLLIFTAISPVVYLLIALYEYKVLRRGETYFGQWKVLLKKELFGVILVEMCIEGLLTYFGHTTVLDSIREIGSVILRTF